MFPAEFPMEGERSFWRVSHLASSPVLFQSTIQRGEHQADLVRPWSSFSAACSAPLWCQELCHPSQWLYWFGQHKLRIAQPQVCHFAMDIWAVLWGGVATSLEMKNPQCWARGENLHILFQISWTSQDSFIGFCMLFILGDEIRYLFRFKWPVCASCSMRPF